MYGLFETVQSWSRRTFGPAYERGPVGPLKHIKKEVDEALAEPQDIVEYADILILLFDATWRAGFTEQDLLEAANEKLVKIATREYPKVADGEVCEHDRTKDSN